MQTCARLGRTGWNAFSINCDYRTGTHTDGKNVAESYSALLILETGAPFAGGLYMLPQYHVGVAARQGAAVFHRSGDPDVGLHGNSAIHLQEPGSHRISVVLYQTRLHTAKQVESTLARAFAIPRDALTPVAPRADKALAPASGCANGIDAPGAAAPVAQARPESARSELTVGPAPLVGMPQAPAAAAPGAVDSRAADAAHVARPAVPRMPPLQRQPLMGPATNAPNSAGLSRPEQAASTLLRFLMAAQTPMARLRGAGEAHGAPSARDVAATGFRQGVRCPQGSAPQQGLISAERGSPCAAGVGSGSWVPCTPARRPDHSSARPHGASEHQTTRSTEKRGVAGVYAPREDANTVAMRQLQKLLCSDESAGPHEDQLISQARAAAAPSREMKSRTMPQGALPGLARMQLHVPQPQHPQQTPPQHQQPQLQRQRLVPGTQSGSSVSHREQQEQQQGHYALVRRILQNAGRQEQQRQQQRQQQQHIPADCPTREPLAGKGVDLAAWPGAARCPSLQSALPRTDRAGHGDASACPMNGAQRERGLPSLAGGTPLQDVQCGAAYPAGHDPPLEPCSGAQRVHPVTGATQQPGTQAGASVRFAALPPPSVRAAMHGHAQPSAAPAVTTNPLTAASDGTVRAARAQPPGTGEGGSAGALESSWPWPAGMLLDIDQAAWKAAVPPACAQPQPPAAESVPRAHVSAAPANDAAVVLP